jgi:endonuclease-3
VKPVDWVKAFEPLIKQYKGRKHPLNYQNRYQLLVMVLLSAQDSDRNINLLAPAFFERYPSMKVLATAKPEDLYRYIKHVRNFATKARWLTHIATTLEDDKNIPTTLEELTKLPGVGRKSANVIIRESGGPAEGIIVDLHVRRVAPRIGIATSDKPEKIEKQMMEVLPKRSWNDAGMACSFLGREICRPTNPKCGDCVMIDVCHYYKTVIKKKKA